MHPYWIRTTVSRPGVGITARSEADAIEVFHRAFGRSEAITEIGIVMDIGDLDQNHVVPNMGDWLRRGVWFPLGRDQISD